MDPTALYRNIAVACPLLQELPCVDCPEYVALPARDKLDRMWNKIKASKHPKGKYPNNWVGILGANAAIANTGYNGTISETFDRFSDEYAARHAKVIHTHGPVAKVRFEATADSPYTGLFAGQHEGVLRASLVKDPYAPCKGVPFTKGCFAPGIAVKLLRDGTYSSNWIAMTSLGDGQGWNFNFFLNPMKIWVPKPLGAAASVVMAIFSLAAKLPFHLGSKEFASMDPHASLTKAKAPSNVYFVPPAGIAKRFSEAPHEFREDFAEISSGTELYEVWAPGEEGCLCDLGDAGKNQPCLDPTKCRGAQKIGRLVTTSEFLSSDWGDTNIFFQHERFVRKDRRVCQMAEAMKSTDVYRMSQNLGDRCLTNDRKCTSAQEDTCSWGFWCSKPVEGKSSGKCPFS